MPSLTALGFLFLVLFWPWLLQNANIKVAGSILMFLVLLFTWHFNSSELVSYWSGLTTILKLLRRNKPRIWGLLALPVLVMVFVLSFVFTLVGFFRKRETTQLLWIALVGRFTHDRSP